MDIQSFARGELVKLVSEDRVGQVTNSIIKTIRDSFRNDIVLRPVMTQAEIKRRFDVCIRTFVELRRDLGWSVARILDALPKALRANLDGGTWTPQDETAHATWSPGT